MNLLRKSWSIEGYDSITEIFEQNVPLGAFTVRQMEAMLRTLASKKSWTIVWRNNWCICKARNTIVTAAVVANAENLENLSHPFYISVGSNPFFVAHVNDK